MVTANNMNRGYSKWITAAITLALLIFIFIFFSEIVWYILIAAVLAFLGNPIVTLLSKIKIKGKELPGGLKAALTLIGMSVFFMGIIAVFLPLIASQAKMISSINPDDVRRALTSFTEHLEFWLHENQILKQDQKLADVLLEEVKPLIGAATFSSLFSNIASFMGSLFMGFFSVLFITFFFLKDQNLFVKIILLFVRDDSERKVLTVLSRTRGLLERYFTGLLIQLSTMATMISLGLWIVGVPNALLIGTFGGMLNVIPYIGPIIGMTTGIILTSLGMAGIGEYSLILPFVLKVAGVFLSANLIDNILLQPLIFSTSVKAHPLEIFVVIIMAGTMGGVVGMILAIPVYTIIRVAGQEYLGAFPVIGKLTRHIDKE
jgi:predicted PurR-regulated permease PerM